MQSRNGTGRGQDGDIEPEEISDSFETVYRNLEDSVGRLETGGLTLEESIALYERGMRLARRCKEMLDAAELRVSRLEEEFGTGGDPRISEDPPEWLYGSER